MDTADVKENISETATSDVREHHNMKQLNLNTDLQIADGGRDCLHRWPCPFGCTAEILQE
jgi:hypothetical protein